jgi:hypothetical protein
LKYRAIDNYLDQRGLSDFGRISADALECTEGFLVAYTCFNLNLEIFNESEQIGDSNVCSFSVIENNIMIQ